MHFNALKCIALALRLAPALALGWTLTVGLAAPARGEILVVPPLFEDFPGAGSVSLHSFPVRNGLSSCWKLETLVTAADLGSGPLTLRRLALRVDEGGGAASHRLRGAVTLSTTRSSKLAARFVENAGAAPVTFFVASRGEAGRGGRRAERLWLELPGGFRFDPGVDGNLLVHLELEAAGDTPLDAAPAPEPRLLVASDFLTAAGEPRRESLVLVLELERDPPPVPADIARPVLRPAPVPPARRAPAPSVAEVSAAVARAESAERERDALAAQVRALEARVSSLESGLRAAVESTRQSSARLESNVASLTSLVTTHYVESALASGRPGPTLLLPVREGGRLEQARGLLIEALEVARSGGFDVGGPSRLLAEGDERLGRGERGLAFVSWSLAFRSLLDLWRPFEAHPPRLGEREAPAPGSPAPARAALGRRPAPYDFEW